MDDLRRTYIERKHGWWIETNATVQCILPPDGLIAVFLLNEIEETLNNNYPTAHEKRRKVWLFPDGGREIAESDDGKRAYCHPRILWDHFLKSN